MKTGETARDRQILEGFKKVGLGIRGLSTFTASGLWTCPEGVTTVYIDACGGGVAFIERDCH